MTFLRFNPAIATITMLLALLPLATVRAIEGGTSHYFPGAYSDFGMNLQVPPGFYFRDDLTYYGAQFGGGTTLGRFGAALVLPVVFDFNLSGAIQFGPREVSGHGSRGGMGYLAVTPLSLTWKWGDVHVNLSQFVYMPTGYYDPEKIVNLGLNRWSFETLAGLTWLDPDRGHEISFNVGFISNTENSDTEYQSGDEFHLDYTVAQYLTKTFGIGVTGYYYTQPPRPTT